MRSKFRTASFIVFVLTVLAMARPATAQSNSSAPNGNIKVLAISKPIAPENRQKIQELLPDEVRATINLYLEGKIEQWFSRQEQGGVVFLLTCHTTEEARSILSELPLSKARLLDFDFLLVGPLTQLRAIMPTAKAGL